MARRRENGAAANATTTENARGSATGAADRSGLAFDAELETAISSLVELAGHVLREQQGIETGPVALPPAFCEQSVAVPDLELASRAEGELRGLRGLLRDYADGIDRASTADDRPRLIADVLRQLLESIFRTRLSLPGEQGRDASGPTAEEFEDARAAAITLLTPSVAVGTDESEGPEPDESDESEYTWIMRNLTSRPLRLRSSEGISWVVPAYGERKLTKAERSGLDIRAQTARGEISVERRLRQEANPYAYALLGTYVWLLPLTFFWGWFFNWGLLGRGLVAIALLAVATAVVVLQKGERRERLKDFLGELPAWGGQTFMYFVVVMICVVFPAVAITFGADLRAVVRHVVDGKASTDEYLTVVARTMQLAFIAIASVLPGLLYFQFDRDRLSTLREKFVHQIFRLDPQMRTRGSIDAKYGSLINEMYGPERSGRFRRLTRGRRAPIFVATMLIVLGWLYVLLKPDVGLVLDEAQAAELFVPRQTAVAFAFLGAYFFTLFALLRGYVRRDLRPKSFSDISVRIIAVAVLAWVLELIFPDDSNTLMVFAFLTGLVPQLALNKIREVTQEWTPRVRRSGAGSDHDGRDDVLPRSTMFFR